MFRSATQMHRGPLAASGILAAGLAIVALAGRADSQPADSGRTTGAERERGRYLVHEVAMCVQCHSPRTADGALLDRGLLQGGRIPVTAPYPNLAWALMAPRLAGIPGWDADDLAMLLQSGARRDGSTPRPPMPPFRMNEADARAVVAYLSSLSP
jgi:mono/diheme cytochrome c family protein